MGKYTNTGGLSCSFCHKPQREVDKIIAGPNVYICSECIKLCMDIIRDNSHQKPTAWGQQKIPSPARIKSYLDQYVVGQDLAKRKIAVAVYNHYKRLEVNEKKGAQSASDVEIQKSNLLLIGPTGTGKTHLAQTLARFLDVPFVISDATSLTEAGYVGEDVENIIAALYQASNQNIERTQRGIVYVDEIDKIAKKGSASTATRDVGGEGVQQALLKILEGSTANIQIRGNKKSPNQEYIQVDTTNILFICGGSFNGLDKVVEQRKGRRAVGFLPTDEPQEKKPASSLHEATPEDLEQFGLIPEFIGRLPVIAAMDALGMDDLVRILVEPKNSLVRQYEKLFKFEKVKLTITEEALKAIAERASAQKAGARSLRSVLENVMLDVMYEMPSKDNLREVVITDEVIKSGAEPKYVPIREFAG